MARWLLNGFLSHEMFEKRVSRRDFHCNFKTTKFRLLILGENTSPPCFPLRPRGFHQTPCFPHPVFSTRPRAFHTPRFPHPCFPHPAFSTPCVFHTPRFPHPGTPAPRFPPSPYYYILNSLSLFLLADSAQ